MEDPTKYAVPTFVVGGCVDGHLMEDLAAILMEDPTKYTVPTFIVSGCVGGHLYWSIQQNTQSLPS